MRKILPQDAPSNIVIYSDLDGTFLDHSSYSYSQSLPAFRRLIQKSIPVIFCSSKTRLEMELLWKEISARDPFITENGGSIYIPVHYFPFPIPGASRHDVFEGIGLGIPYGELLQIYRKLQETFPGHLMGFSDMSTKQIAENSGLTLNAARLAKQREFSVVFQIIDADFDMINQIIDKIKEYGLGCTRGGRYYHLHGDHDKGSAVRFLNELFRKIYDPFFTIGIGDSMNDLPLLKAVDQPVLVKKISGRYEDLEVNSLPHICLMNGIGPLGWAEVVNQILADLEKNQ